VFVKRFFEETLAQTSYLIGCAATHEAIVIDPNRDVAQYLKAAENEGARITHVTETHIHADFVSGSRELAAQSGATLHLSDEGDAAWKYGFAHEAGARLLTTGSRISVGNVQIDAVHTPGHTPEHLAFLVTDGAAANEPIAAATGDFVFVGDVGRPDLLERAASIKGTMETSARTLYHSLLAFATRPDWLQIWPAHGAGSACGKSISDLPQSTLGYERRFNWAFRVRDEEEFVRRVLAGQPEPPTYFAEMKRVNRDGPPVLGELRRPPALGLDALDTALGSGAIVVDTRPAVAYALGHIPGTINIPLTKSFTTWAGWLLPYTSDILLVTDGTASIDRAVRNLALIGLDRIAGVFGESTIDDWTAAGRALGTIPQIRPADLRESIAHGGVSLVDVRGDNEWRAVRIPGARHIPLGYLTARLDEVPRHRPVVVHCAGGSRSSIAASLLRAHGVSQVVNLSGGIGEWQRAGLPVDTEEVGS
jgi:hydroxyacylglutathione hydrolase